MEGNKLFLSIIMPALNEEKNISLALDNTLSAFKASGIDGEIVVINDGSSDATPEIVQRKISEHAGNIRIINHSAPKGIGVSFWDGVREARGNAVCMLPGDNENDPWEIMRYAMLLEHVDIVIPFNYNKWVRSVLRNALSFIYRFIINTTFGVTLNYTNGTVLYRKSILSGLKHQSSGFFFQTDMLIRLVTKGYLFAEVPYRLGMRHSGSSKAVSFPSLFRVIKGYLRLVRDIYFSSETKLDRRRFSDDSLSARRING
ncbi:MAG: glycosyltransferase family 2 protein [Candidatus Omnitrophica bacterium]|nr:glycosyltransferase family 2 protein [Candidatus Omnitrophota bacterium]